MYFKNTTTTAAATTMAVIALSTLSSFYQVNAFTTTITSVKSVGIKNARMFEQTKDPHRLHNQGGLHPITTPLSKLTATSSRRRRKIFLNSFMDDKNEEGNNSEEVDTFSNLLSEVKLRQATSYLQTHPTITLTKSLFKQIFDTIESRTSDAEENNINNRQITETNLEYPLISPARTEMTNMYKTLVDLKHLNVFGAAGNNKRGFPYPAAGSKIITPTLLENVTDMSMVSLTPKPTNNLLFAGVALAILEGFVSLYTGIDFNFLIFTTLFFGILDRFLVNGAVFETIMRTIMPEYTKKILRHEAGHFLCAYLLGCPVEGCVLSSWAALQDSRFGGRSTAVSAGTSFFDPELSDQMNGLKPLSRDSIDRYSVIVMGGIAAEAMNFGRADGGAGDEMALVRFLTSVSPKSGTAASWDAERIRNQARWGAMQAVLLLRHYSECYDALVDALERGGDLGDCIYAIEEAAKKSGKTPLSEPLGYVLDQGLYGEWTTSKPALPHEEEINGESKAVLVDGTTTPKPSSMSSMDKSSVLQPVDTSRNQNIEEDTIASSEAALKKYRQMMEDKLNEIDKRLEDIESGGGKR